ncbi:MAG TPA: SDR family oxidoreductase [Saprospiraceae bacterium]|nr:SDR family oxidoreductase [Saprospiraceae bacterium]HPI09184.1 SDR family oxidoreductase [Saprospiraceae bacterium]
MDTGKTYLLIGGSHGIGLALVQKLTAQGHQVIVLSRTPGVLQDLPNVTHHTFDVLHDNFPTEVLPADLHGLVYLPGTINLRGFASIKPEQFREELEINCIGAIRCIQASLKALKQGSVGSIVLFSTVAVGVGMPFHSSIAAAKGAVEGLTRALAAELAPVIRVNCIAPSLTDTPLAEKLLNTLEKREASAQRHPLKRVGTSEEIAALAAFLLSEDAAWMTGQVLHADGGMSAIKS